MKTKKHSTPNEPAPAPQRPRADVAVLKHDETARELTLEAMRTLQDAQAASLSGRMQIAATFAAALITNPKAVTGLGSTFEEAVARMAFQYADAFMGEAFNRGEIGTEARHE